MHQTFYIGADEEIISIVSKIRKSPLAENILVIPPRALILQSIVNLKLLKKESEKLNKQIMIVTQDQQGQKIIEKAGILAQPSLDKLENKEEFKGDLRPQIRNERGESAIKKASTDKKLKDIGSKSFFNNHTKNESAVYEDKPKNINKDIETEAEIGRSEKKASAIDILRFKSPAPPKKAVGQEQNVQHQDVFNPRKERKIERLFGADSKNDQVKTDLGKKQTKFISGKIKKLCVGFVAACFFVAIALGVYLVIPKAKINVLLKTDALEKDVAVEGSGDISTPDLEEKIIPATAIKKKADLTLSFNSTGKTVISDQKARGMLVIYNEYSKSSQPLVATTRFLTPDGKLFRLIKGVTVPGMAEADGELKAGVIEAEVAADESGEEYNIGPSDFSIPGFKGNPKHEKIYAQSSHSMVGGGLSGNEVAIVSQEDIDSAKLKVEEELENKIREEIKSEVEEDEVVLNEALRKNILNSSSLTKSDAVASSFDYKAEMEIEALVFCQEDITAVIKTALEKKVEKSKLSLGLGEEIKMEIFEVETEYGYPDADFESGKIDIKVHGKAVLRPEIDIESLKKDLLGKNDEQIKESLKNYSQVRGVEVEYWPKFFSKKIPQYEKRVEIKIAPDFSP